MKRERNPWELLQEIRGFASKGFDAIPSEWLGTYFRWWGVYKAMELVWWVGRAAKAKPFPFLC